MGIDKTRGIAYNMRCINRLRQPRVLLTQGRAMLTIMTRRNGIEILKEESFT